MKTLCSVSISSSMGMAWVVICIVLGVSSNNSCRLYKKPSIGMTGQRSPCLTNFNHSQANKCTKMQPQKEEKEKKERRELNESLAVRDKYALRLLSSSLLDWAKLTKLSCWLVRQETRGDLIGGRKSITVTSNKTKNVMETLRREKTLLWQRWRKQTPRLSF